MDFSIEKVYYFHFFILFMIQSTFFYFASFFSPWSRVREWSRHVTATLIYYSPSSFFINFLSISHVHLLSLSHFSFVTGSRIRYEKEGKSHEIAQYKVNSLSLFGEIFHIKIVRATLFQIFFRCHKLQSFFLLLFQTILSILISSLCAFYIFILVSSPYSPFSLLPLSSCLLPFHFYLSPVCQYS